MRLSKNTIIVFAQETTYGQLPSFDYSIGALLVERGELSILQDTTNYEPLRKEFGVKDVYVSGIHAQLEFDIVLKGDGVDGSGNVIEPQIGKLLEACMFDKQENVSEGITVGWTYTTGNGIVGVDFPSVAFEVYVAGNNSQADKYTLVGCVGTFRLTATAGRYPTLTFTFLGKLYSDPETVSIPAVSYPQTEPVPLEGINFTFGGYGFCVNELTIELGNRTAVRRCLSEANSVAGTVITGRETTGSIDPEAVFESDFPVFSKMKSGDILTMSMTIGSEAGNKITVSSDNVKIRELRFGDRDGIAIQDISLTFIQPDGGSELTIKFE